jgi:rSAM/selenodomain-associated transferase 2
MNLSIIIPARNDAEALKRTLAHLHASRETAAVEIIVAAACDADAAVATGDVGTILIRPGGSTRAELMNAGAAIARGDVLLFLHADSLPPPNAAALIDAMLEHPHIVGGAFEHRFIERDWRLDIVCGINRLRYRLTHNYYGDQGIFVRRSVFRQIGGFRSLSLMEDLDFSQRLKRLGPTCLITVPVETSGRRFLERGPWRTLFYCAWLVSLWTCGVDVERCAERWRGPVHRAPGSRWRRTSKAARQS